MPQLILKRSNEWNNRFRKFDVIIDDSFRGTIANGKTVEFELSEGAHSVFCRIDWCRSASLELHLQNQQSQTLKVTGMKFGSILMPLTLAVFVFTPLLVRINENLKYIYYLYIPLGIWMFYHLTIGRKKFLVLRQSLESEIKK